MEICVREARREDIAAIVRFNALLAHETEGRTLDERVLRGGVENALANPDLCRYFVATLGDTVVGQCMVTHEWSDWRNGRIWWLQSVYVEEGSRERGVFRALFEHVEKAAREGGEAVALRLYVERENQRAMKVYERMGMTKRGYAFYEKDWTLADTEP
ncbi:MAG: hypothetical protein GHCLOJNM_02306 [bacterium]|nr:hypothetical protein [bacterium]